ncbi:MAG TPA: hypothetical protein VKA67_12715 [Verrucomicrobiae bacterium]|nr:hypothetical protein [Verrucomicrobiae bacterium]
MDLRPLPPGAGAGFGGGGSDPYDDALGIVKKSTVRVLREEAVGMYEVAVLEA